MAKEKAKVERYNPGSVLLKNISMGIAEKYSGLMQQKMDEATPDLTPEQRDVAKLEATPVLQNIQQSVASAPKEQQSAIAEQKAQLLQQRAEAQGRGLTGGERIAMAVLSAAPIIAASFQGNNAQSAAAQGANQIRQGIQSANTEANNAAVAQKDAELAALSGQEKALNDEQKIKQEQAFIEKRDAAKFANDKEIAAMSQEGKSSREDLAQRREGRAVATMTKSNPVYKAALTNLSEFNKGMSLLNSNPNGLTDVSILFNYIKNLDNSTVRESERAMLSNASGILSRIAKLPENMRSGALLSPEEREQLKSIGLVVNKNYARQLKKLNDKTLKGLPEGSIKEEAARGLTSYEDVLDEDTAQMLNQSMIQDREDRIAELEAKAAGKK